MFQITKFLIWLSPRKQFIPTQIKLDKTWMGSGYGGFYVHLPALKDESTVLSFGVGEDISFDLNLMEAKNVRIHTFDPTRGVDRFIRPFVEKYESLSFAPVGLSARDGEDLFFPPENTEHVSCSVIPNQQTRDRAYKVQMKRLSSILKEKKISKIDLLKIDIEGAEYEVIPDILESEIDVKQLQIEIHPDLFPDGKKKTRELIKKLNQHGFKIFGVSQICRELSFIR
jgi:FkbM family methyltransferase